MGRVERPDIAYCITCKNRLWQLRHTLPSNLEMVADDGRSEIVLVNYNSDDDLDDWIRSFQSYVDSGVLRYIHETTERYFHASKAKNLAHLGATADFVVNLDADNYVGATIPLWRSLWIEDPDAVIHGFQGDYNDGTYGRIGLKRSHFLAVGGYDEDMLPMLEQDLDLLARLEAIGLAVIRTRQDGDVAIRQGQAVKLKYCGVEMTWQEMSAANKAQMERNLRGDRLRVNERRSPRAVLLNFTTGVEL